MKKQNFYGTTSLEGSSNIEGSSIMMGGLLIVAQVVAFMIKISIFRFKALCVALSVFFFGKFNHLLVKANQLYHHFQLIPH